MSKTSFKKFVEQEKAVDSKQKSIDWEGKKRTYLKRLDKLFNDVEDYLREFTESGAIRIEKRGITIDEEYIGEYDVPVLRIHLCGKRADLVPIGTNVVGTPGRIDLKGHFDTIRFILADKKEKSPQGFAGISWLPMDKERVREKTEEWTQRKRNYVWKIITDPPDMRFIEMNEDSFLSALQEVLDA